MQDEEVDIEQNDIATAAASTDPAQGLVAVRALRTLADRLEEVQVASAREQGWSWQAIAEVLQISRQAVHQKHSAREKAPPKQETRPTRSVAPQREPKR